MDKTYNFNKQKLIEVLKNNREKHRQEAIEAGSKYRKAILKRLSRLRKKVASGESFSITEIGENLPVPVDYTHAYDLAIKMFEFCENETIELNTHEFREYVLDQWDWSSHVNCTLNFYKNRKY